jgi:hypothetical protein
MTMTQYLLIAATVILLIAVLVGAASGVLKRPSGGTKPLPFVRIDNLFTPAERSFYGVLLQVIANRYVVFGKIRLADIIKPTPGLTPSERTSALNRISGKHVDFALCDPSTLATVAVIELDDKSHQAERRKQRDAFVDSALSAAGVPVLHVPAQKTYSTTDIGAQIQNILA